jgi:hypothetical protein
MSKFHYDGFRNNLHYVFDGVGCEIAFKSKKIVDAFLESNLNDHYLFKFNPIIADEKLNEWIKNYEIPSKSKS